MAVPCCGLVELNAGIHPTAPKQLLGPYQNPEAPLCIGLGSMREPVSVGCLPGGKWRWQHISLIRRTNRASEKSADLEGRLWHADKCNASTDGNAEPATGCRQPK